jgi:glycosyltransferase involved in cell wall biosynthesis
LKIELVSYSDANGGAFRAAYRLHRALISAGKDSILRVSTKRSDDWRVVAPDPTAQSRVQARLRALSDRVMTYQKSDNRTLHTAAAFFSSGIDSVINSSDSQVANLHWVAGNMLSVEDIGRIDKPVVWTLHDMWPFCGAEHYADDSPGARFETGYCRTNRPDGNSGLDLDRWVWKRKGKAWHKPMHIVTPSRWLAECARRSVLMRDWPITVIPNPLNIQTFRPRPREFCRELFDLPQNVRLIAFGALNVRADHRKGFDLLLAALKMLSLNVEDVACVVFGRSEFREFPDIGMPIYRIGQLYDEVALAALYSAVDVMVVPSRQENLPQTGTEAQACGCPVVAFNCTGFPDVVDHRTTGYLAEAYSISDLGSGISWVIESEDRRRELSVAARKVAVRLWSEEAVIPQYVDVYQTAIQNSSGRLRVPFSN